MKWTLFDRPGHLVNRAARLAGRYADLQMRGLGLGGASFQVLSLLRDGTKMTQKDLAVHAKVEQPSMAQLLKRMERDGMIDRSATPSDARSSQIGLTEKALRLLPLVDATTDAFNDRAVQGMSPMEVETLIRLLKQLIANLEDSETSVSTQEK